MIAKMGYLLISLLFFVVFIYIGLRLELATEPPASTGP